MTPALSDRLEDVARALEGSDLVTLSGVLDVAAVIDVLEHAAAVAAEVEYLSDASGQIVQTHVAPAYPPLVRLLGRAVDVTR